MDIVTLYANSIFKDELIGGWVLIKELYKEFQELTEALGDLSYDGKRGRHTCEVWLFKPGATETNYLVWLIHW